MLGPEEEVIKSIEAFVNMIERLKDKPVKRFLLFSSGGAVYGNHNQSPVDERITPRPISPYGVAKLTMEHYLHMFSRLYGLEYIIVRPSNPFGPRQNFRGNQGIIPIFLYQMLKGKPIQVWGKGDMHKDYLYIDDLVQAVTGLMQTGFDNEIYNIGSGEGTSVLEIASQAGSVSGIEPEISYGAPKAHDVHHIILSTKKLQKRTGWRQLIPINDGILNTFEWLKQVVDQHG